MDTDQADEQTRIVVVDVVAEMSSDVNCAVTHADDQQSRDCRPWRLDGDDRRRSDRDGFHARVDVDAPVTADSLDPAAEMNIR